MKYQNVVIEQSKHITEFNKINMNNWILRHYSEMGETVKGNSIYPGWKSDIFQSQM